MVGLRRPYRRISVIIVKIRFLLKSLNVDNSCMFILKLPSDSNKKIGGLVLGDHCANQCRNPKPWTQSRSQEDSLAVFVLNANEKFQLQAELPVTITAPSGRSRDKCRLRALYKP